MVKNLKKVILLGLLLIISNSNLCYADLYIPPSPAMEFSVFFLPLCIFIMVLIFMISTIAIIIRKNTVKNGKIVEKRQSPRFINNMIYIENIILSFLILFLLKSWFDLYEIIFIISITVLLISILFKLGENKISSITCILVMGITCIAMVVCCLQQVNIKKYNETFSKKQNGLNYNEVVELINLVNSNNKNDKNKIKISYGRYGKSYETTEELQILVDKLSQENNYYNLKYDTKGYYAIGIFKINIPINTIYLEKVK